MKKYILSLLLLSCMIASHTWAAAPDFEIPEMKIYANAEECKADNELVAKISQYLFTTELPEDVAYARSAISFVTSWVQASDEILISLSEQTTGHFFSCDPNLSIILLGTYICGCTRYNREVLTSKEFTFEMHYYALEATLRYYEKNNKFLGQCKKMDKMLKSLHKGKLRKEQERLFAVSVKD